MSNFIHEYFERCTKGVAGYRMTPLERFIYDKGQDMVVGAREDIPLGEKKQCFKNAADLSYRRPHLTYCEGLAFSLALSIAFPMHHAWCIDEDDRVIDPTWDDPEDCLYRGVTFTKTQVFEEMRRTGVYGMLDQGLGFNTRLAKELFEWGMK